MLQKRHSPLFRMTLALSFMLMLFLCTCTGQAHSPKRVHSSRSQASLAEMARRVIHYVGGRKPYVLLTPAAVLPYYSQDKDQLPTTDGSFSLRTPRGTVSVYWTSDAVLEDGSMLVRTGPNAASSEALEPQVMHGATSDAYRHHLPRRSSDCPRSSTARGRMAACERASIILLQYSIGAEPYRVRCEACQIVRRP